MAPSAPAPAPGQSGPVLDLAPGWFVGSLAVFVGSLAVGSLVRWPLVRLAARHHHQRELWNPSRIMLKEIYKQ